MALRRIHRKRPVCGQCHGKAVSRVSLDRGYTSGMKTAVSVPDPVFREADQFARRAKKSRSQLYSDALVEYLARHVPDAVTEAMNEVCDTIATRSDDFVKTASRRVLERQEW